MHRAMADVSSSAFLVTSEGHGEIMNCALQMSNLEEKVNRVGAFLEERFIV